MSVQPNDTHKKTVNVSHAEFEKKSQFGHARLPCRGCLSTCKNYDHCDGKLWRMSE